MSAITEDFKSDKELTLFDPSASPLTVRIVKLTLTRQEDIFREFHLTFKVNLDIYQRIKTEPLFNLKPELRGLFSAGNFQSEPDIEIEVILQPDLLPRLTSSVTNPDQIVTYLPNLSQEEPDNPLLCTENWFCLQVKQAIKSGTIGYRTLWAYLNPAAISQEANVNSKISEGMVNFIKDWSDADMSVTQEAISQSLEEMNQAFAEFADQGLVGTEEAITEMVSELTTAFEELADAANQAISEQRTIPVEQDILPRQSIFEEMVKFFTSDDWSFVKLKGEPTLRLVFQGKNGKWDCYARARVEEQQFVFYSIGAVKVPKPKRRSVGEFITRANYGMIIGNFELNFDNGEIRYKTSIDVKGNVLTSETFKQLVYTNVLTMDHYLPGIISVISGEMSPEDAIATIEAKSE